MTAALKTLVLVAFVGLLIPDAIHAWEPDADDEAQTRAAAELERYRSDPGIAAKLDEAYGFAILPHFFRLAAGIGFNYGRGLVVEESTLVGRVWTLQGTLGFTYGLEYHSQILIFRDAETMRDFKRRWVEFQGRGSGVLAVWGKAADPGFVPGVAIYSRTKGGAMVELAAMASLYRFRPVEQ